MASTASSRHRQSSRHSSQYPTTWSAWEWNEQYKCECRYRKVARDDLEWDYSTPALGPAIELQEHRNAGNYVQPTIWTPRDRSADPSGNLGTINEDGQLNDDRRSSPSENYFITSGDSLSGITEGLASEKFCREELYDHRAEGKNKGEAATYDGMKASSNDLFHESKVIQLTHQAEKNVSYPSGYAPSLQRASQTQSAGYGGSQSGMGYGHPSSYPPPQDTYAGYSVAKSSQSTHSDCYPASSDNGTPSVPLLQDYNSFKGTQSDSNPNRRNIQTKNRRVNYVELDSRFKVARSSDFKFGRVFKVFWSEPRESAGTEITALYGENSLYNICRFVVMENKKGHAICIPIWTHGNQGTMKSGVYPEDHAVVYSSKRDGPSYLPGEKKRMSKKAIRIEVKDPCHKLDPTSRLNFTRIYTVEHSMKVLFIGQVAANYEHALASTFNQTPPLSKTAYQLIAPHHLYSVTHKDPIQPIHCPQNLQTHGPQQDMVLALLFHPPPTIPEQIIHQCKQWETLVTICGSLETVTIMAVRRVEMGLASTVSPTDYQVITSNI